MFVSNEQRYTIEYATMRAIKLHAMDAFHTYRRNTFTAQPEDTEKFTARLLETRKKRQECCREEAHLLCFFRFSLALVDLCCTHCLVRMILFKMVIESHAPLDMNAMLCGAPECCVELSDSHEP